MIKGFAAFLRDEHGAVTVDWVVLTGLIVVLGLAVFALVGPASTDLGTRIKARVDTITP